MREYLHSCLVLFVFFGGSELRAAEDLSGKLSSPSASLPSEEQCVALLDGVLASSQFLNEANEFLGEYPAARKASGGRLFGNARSGRFESGLAYFRSEEGKSFSLISKSNSESSNWWLQKNGTGEADLLFILTYKESYKEHLGYSLVTASVEVFSLGSGPSQNIEPIFQTPVYVDHEWPSRVGLAEVEGVGWVFAAPVSSRSSKFRVSAIDRFGKRLNVKGTDEFEYVTPTSELIMSVPNGFVIHSRKPKDRSGQRKSRLLSFSISPSSSKGPGTLNVLDLVQKDCSYEQHFIRGGTLFLSCRGGLGYAFRLGGLHPQLLHKFEGMQEGLYSSLSKNGRFFLNVDPEGSESDSALLTGISYKIYDVVSGRSYGGSVDFKGTIWFPYSRSGPFELLDDGALLIRGVSSDRRGYDELGVNLRYKTPVSSLLEVSGPQDRED